MTKICVVCGRQFEGTYHQISCGDECQRIRRMQMSREGCKRNRERKREEKLRKLPSTSIQQVLAMAAARGISYGKMVQLLEKGAEQ